MSYLEKIGKKITALFWKEAVTCFRSSRKPQAVFCRHISLICPPLTF